MKQQINDYMAEFKLHNTDDSADTKYYGYLAPDGRWIIMQEVTSTGVFRYAAGSVATRGYSGYATGWTGRAGLTYGYITEVLN